VRLSELIMSSRWVRPISEINRWFIRLEVVWRRTKMRDFTRRDL
jgi:hypothetical protein